MYPFLESVSSRDTHRLFWAIPSSLFWTSDVQGAVVVVSTSVFGMRAPIYRYVGLCRFNSIRFDLRPLLVGI